jgi:hypothetical protein
MAEVPNRCTEAHGNILDTIKNLCEDADESARRLRGRAFVLLALALMFDLAGVGWAVIRGAPGGQVELTWVIAVLSALSVLTALLLFAARTAWNFSNVWLGRAGTLEDLRLILRLLGVAEGTTLGVPVSTFKQATEAFLLLRREFEGKLLEGPSVQLPGKSG